jgi:hypothetical protein
VSAVLPFRRTTELTRADLRRVARARARQRETLAMVDGALARGREARAAAAREERRRLFRDRVAAALLVYTVVLLQLAGHATLATAAVLAAVITLALVGVLLYAERPRGARA